MAGAHEEIGYHVMFAQVVAEQVGIGKGIHWLRMLLLETGVDQLKRRESARGSDQCWVPQKGRRMLRVFREPWELHLLVECPGLSAHCQQAVGPLLKMEELAR
jgi:hypothetical protein